jgi:alkanesulfonate monooxygenase SsuD/methylene tetrahydromethanopterin reductase-like flavin-dependent oxidoreductase (luciferase family)
MIQAIEIYRANFKPSRQTAHSYVMLGLNVVVAETDAQARYLFSSVQQAFTNLRRGAPGQIPPPVLDIDSYWSPQEKASASMTLLCSAVGSPETVERAVDRFMKVTQPDEIIATAHIYDHSARLRSFELLGEIGARLRSPDTRNPALLASAARPE